MRFLIWPILILLFIAFQFTWYTLFRSSQTPDLLLLLIIVHALDKGEKEGALWGAALGFLQDITTFTLLGFYTLSRSLIGFLVGVMREGVYKDSPSLYLGMVAMTTILVKLSFIMVMLVWKGFAVEFTGQLIVLGQCLFWNLLCALPVRFVYNFVCEWLSRRDGGYY